MTKNLIQSKNEILKRFKCQQSGNCCKCDGNVYITNIDKLNMAKKLNINTIEFQQHYVQLHNGWESISTSRFRPRCFLDKNDQCLVYSARPKSCKTYPHWNSIWQSEEALLTEAEQCPGLKLAIEGYQNSATI